MTQKQALKQLEEYCRVNNMHLANCSFSKSEYVLVKHDAPGEWVPGVANVPCHRLSGYHAGLQAKASK